jgi:hypothetical protein
MLQAEASRPQGLCLPVSLDGFFLTLQETVKSGALQKLSMVCNVIIDECSDEKV